jgi:chlorite dismutase
VNWYADHGYVQIKVYSSLKPELVPTIARLAHARGMRLSGHVPAFMQDEEPKAYLCVYPFVRSYEWYLLPEEERRAMLTEHGMLARPYPDVRANTVSSFALGDYEWMLAFEADELHRIVDLMRALRAAAARRHTREEVPFYTGRWRELSRILELW